VEVILKSAKKNKKENLKKMHYLEEPKAVQFELSSNCNANCIGCSRADPFNELKLNPRIPKNKFLDFDKFVEILHAKRFQSVEEIQFCASIDDPLMHPRFLDMLYYIVQHTNFRIIIHTNASLRSSSYWQDMAKILKGTKYTLNFSVDGLEDTNHIYRRGTNFKKIMENARAFISAGGSPSWQWVVFPWNKHQIEEAKQLAKSMGFRSFRERNDTSLDNLDLHELSKKFENEKRRHTLSWSEYVHALKRFKGNIYCKTANDEKAYFVAHTGEIFPCCFMYNIRYRVVDFEEHWKRYDNVYGKNWNNVYYHHIDKILEHSFFKNDLTESWNNVDHEKLTPCSRNPVCTNTCSVNNRQRWEIEHKITMLESGDVEFSKNKFRE